MTRTLTTAELVDRYRRRHGAPIEPVQGFDSLAPELRLAYSLGRVRGFTDLGTFVNKPHSDHAGHPPGHPPAWAFDLGRSDRFLLKGWYYLKARRLFRLYVKNHEALHIEYVILGDRIWSRERGLHSYGPDRSHFFHMHVSGHDPNA